MAGYSEFYPSFLFQPFVKVLGNNMLFICSDPVECKDVGHGSHESIAILFPSRQV